mmetsp:Transcript_20728/g.70525  ORF Transcript_20728/g.70525 Transcript_20728/m.70525 type:complete len:500 (+) Transcript_20728:163-1662(+)
MTSLPTKGDPQAICKNLISRTTLALHEHTGYQHIYEQIDSMCDVTNKHGVSFRSLSFYLFSLAAKIVSAQVGLFLKLTGWNSMTLHLAPYDGDFIPTTLMTQTDLKLLFLYETVDVQFPSFEFARFERALQKALNEFPFLNFSFDIIQQKSKFYCVAQQSLSLHLKFSSKTFLSQLSGMQLVDGILHFCISCLSKLMFSTKLYMLPAFQKFLLFYRVNSGSVIITIVKKDDGAANLNFRINHAMSDGWTQHAFISYLSKAYEDDIAECVDSQLKSKCVQARLHALQSRLNYGLQQENFDTDICSLPVGEFFHYNTLFGPFTHTPWYEQRCFNFTKAMKQTTWLAESSAKRRLSISAHIIQHMLTYKAKTLCIGFPHRIHLDCQGNHLINTSQTFNSAQSTSEIASEIEWCEQLVHRASLVDVAGCEARELQNLTQIATNTIFLNHITVSISNGSFSPFAGRQYQAKEVSDEMSFFSQDFNLLHVASLDGDIVLFYETGL